jgi:hypothetical protein
MQKSLVKTESVNLKQLKKKLSELRNELQSIQKRKVELNEKLDETLEFLSSENSSTENMYEELLHDIAELESKLDVRGEDKYQSSAAAPKKKKKSESSKDAKTLYRKISAICHPDKTDDESLHELYIEAQKAYENDDTDQLEYIYSSLVDNSEATITKKQDEERELLQAIDAINKKIVNESQEYFQIKMSPIFQIHKNIHSDKISSQMRGRHQYSELLYRKIEDAAQKKDELTEKIAENENNL